MTVYWKNFYLFFHALFNTEYCYVNMYSYNMVGSSYVRYRMRGMFEGQIKHEAKPSTFNNYVEILYFRCCTKSMQGNLIG